MTSRANRRDFIQSTISAATGLVASEVLASPTPFPGKNGSNPRGGNPVLETSSGDKARRFEISIRYIPWTVNYEDEFPEQTWFPVERRVGFDPQLSALIVLDVWGWHFMPTLRMRMDGITRERIKPVVEACRKAGLLVVYATSPRVAKKYPGHRFWPASEWNRVPQYSPPGPESCGGGGLPAEQAVAAPTKSSLPGELCTWPLPEMKARAGRFKEYSQLSDPDAPRRTQEQLYLKYRTHPAIEPLPNDFVVATREELHGLLTKQKRFHLFCVGFVSNGCMFERDYGTRNMSYLGYQANLLRDCTTALETAETVAPFEQSHASVHNLEFWFPSTTSTALLDGLGKMG